MRTSSDRCGRAGADYSAQTERESTGFNAPDSYFRIFVQLVERNLLTERGGKKYRKEEGYLYFGITNCKIPLQNSTSVDKSMPEMPRLTKACVTSGPPGAPDCRQKQGLRCNTASLLQGAAKKFFVLFF